MIARTRLPRWLALACVAVLASAAPATAADTGTALDRALDRIVATPAGPPGVSVLIQGPDGREFRRRGVGDIQTRRRPTASEHTRIASVAKAFSGAVALQLVQQGRLSLDDTIGERLPGLLPKASAVTLAQVLHHTGGVPEYIKQKAFIERLVKAPKAYVAPRTLVRAVRNLPLDFPPGSRYQYSDTDNIIVGLMAEAATGESYEKLLARLVYDPLSLRGTSLPRTVRMPRPYLHGYEVAAGKPPEDVSQVINPSGAWASGGIVSTPLDLGSFFRGYVGDRLLDADTKRRQRVWVRGSSQPAGPGTNSAGLGLFRYRTRCGSVYGHTGSFPGYRLFTASNAAGTRSVVFVANAQIVPGRGSRRVSNQIRAAQLAAVCHVLR